MNAQKCCEKKGGHLPSFNEEINLDQDLKMYLRSILGKILKKA